MIGEKYQVPLENPAEQGWQANQISGSLDVILRWSKLFPPLHANCSTSHGTVAPNLSLQQYAAANFSSQGSLPRIFH